LQPVLRQASVEQIPIFFELFISSDENDDESDERATSDESGEATTTTTTERSGGRRTNEEAVSAARDELLPLVARRIVDRSGQVRQAAGQALIGVAHHLPPAELRTHVATIVRKLARDTVEQEHRIEAARLLHALAPLAGAELSASVVLPLQRRLARDVVYAVRGAVASQLGAAWRAAGAEAAAGELGLLTRLAGDDVWAVRRAAVDALAELAPLLPAPRRASLVVLLERALADASRWVRAAAARQLAALLVAVAPPRGARIDLAPPLSDTDADDPDAHAPITDDST
jgi:hypothetical protein